MDYDKKYDDFNHEFGVFMAYLDRDLEGWFCADIACCDFCYEDFLSVWPHANNADGAEFQSNTIDVGVFYSGSRLRDVFSEKRFFELMQHVECPWCLQSGTNNLYPYELPFTVIDNFIQHSNELSELAKETPFLLLEHPFAKTVFRRIKDLSKQTKSQIYSSTLFRARVTDGLKSNNPSEFCFPPDKYAAENRYNHAGTSALYLGDSVKTCFYELREQECTVAEIKLKRKVKILDLSNPVESHEGLDDFLNTLVYSALLSARRNGEGQNKQEYIFSRFVSDCARASGFDAIKYPSTRPLVDSHNLVLINQDLAIGKGSEIGETSIYNG